MSKQKRKAAEIVDLTGDDEDSHHRGPSRAKFSRPNPSSQQNRAALLTPPSSSQTRPRSSQSYNTNNPYISQPTPTRHSKAERDSWVASTQEEEADIAREIDLTEDFDDDVYENYQLYGILNTKIVGCRYYDGRATVGEYVRVRREPSNPYDSNAIRIDNVLREQIGHIGRQVAAKLAPLMDSGSLLVEGALTGAKVFYDCPIGLRLFGTNDPMAGAALCRQMQDLKLPVNEYLRADKERKKRMQELEKQRKAREKAAAAMQKRHGKGVVVDNEGPNKYSNLGMLESNNNDQPAEEVNMDQLLAGGATAMFNPRDVQDVVKRLGAGEDVLAKLPMAEQPAQLATVLLPYQRQGLKWMLDHESPQLPKGNDDVVQMWKKAGNGVYTNIATNFSFTKAPELASGGLLADDMGLGKFWVLLSTSLLNCKLLTWAQSCRQNHPDHLSHYGRPVQERTADSHHRPALRNEQLEPASRAACQEQIPPPDSDISWSRKHGFHSGAVEGVRYCHHDLPDNDARIVPLRIIETAANTGEKGLVLPDMAPHRAG